MRSTTTSTTPSTEPSARPGARPSRRWIGPVLIAAALVGLSCSAIDDTASTVNESTSAADRDTTTTTATPAESEQSEPEEPEPEEPGAEEPGVEELFPDVVGVEANQADDGTWQFAVTLSSPYDSPERYADAWRVVGPDGTVYGERVLAHDHANEQPFTRSQSGIEIPEGVTEVLVEGRDQISGWGGATMTYTLP